jgi:16S rRNA (uracil1498-N3)-methyltransferase
VPPVLAVQSLAAWLAQLPVSAQRRFLLSPAEGAASLREAAAGAQELLTLSGPEGGLAPDEEAAALRHGFVRARLGERILRAETAPLAVLAWATLSA